MVLPWDLEDWLTETGDHVVRKMAARGSEPLSPMEQLVYEVWLFDTETRNGGVSQYFGNRGMKGWNQLKSACENFPVPMLKQFIDEVDQALGSDPNPYKVALNTSPPLEERYWDVHQAGIVEELRQVVSNRA
jgi:hypothetical protein